MFFPQVFPCKERMLAGEDQATLLTGNWRHCSDFNPTKLTMAPLSDSLPGKQIEVVLPKQMYPGYRGCWKATCQRPITLQTNEKEVCMRLIFSGYTGDKSTLSSEDLECLSPSEDLWVDVPISPSIKGSFLNTSLETTV
jgi:hypothetical protein